MLQLDIPQDFIAEFDAKIRLREWRLANGASNNSAALQAVLDCVATQRIIQEAFDEAGLWCTPGALDILQELYRGYAGYCDLWIVTLDPDAGTYTRAAARIDAFYDALQFIIQKTILLILQHGDPVFGRIDVAPIIKQMIRENERQSRAQPQPQPTDIKLWYDEAEGQWVVSLLDIDGDTGIYVNVNEFSTVCRVGADVTVKKRQEQVEKEQKCKQAQNRQYTDCCNLMENQIPQEFLEAIMAEYGLVHPDTPSEEEVVAVWTCADTQQKIRDVFDVAGLTLTQDTLDVILQDYKLSAAFLHDYSDLANEDDKPAQIEDYYRVMDNAIQKILRYVQEYGDPHYDPLAKVMANFYSAISDADIKEMVGCLKATEAAAKTQ